MDPITLSFFVQVNPCRLSSLNAVVEKDEYVYILGDEGMRSQFYKFEADKDCGYQMEISVETELPNWIAVAGLQFQDEPQLVFGTKDLNHIGTHTVKFLATIKEPTDYKQNNFKSWVASTEVSIIVKDACEVTVFDPFDLPPMSTNVMNEPMFF